ncbi:hypothetical protein A9239_17740 [Methanosarcina sp. A14]|nr:hypothetical protein A9239_17740 [Methanosarcina sp. A14]
MRSFKVLLRAVKRQKEFSFELFSQLLRAYVLKKAEVTFKLSDILSFLFFPAQNQTELIFGLTAG